MIIYTDNDIIKHRVRGSFVCMLLMLCNGVTAQLFSGIIQDEAHRPLALVNVVLLDHDSTFIDGTVTNDEGFFTFNKIEGTNSDRYLVRLSILGYETAIYPITPDKKKQFILKEKSIELEGVVVEGRRKIFRAEENSIIAGIEHSILSNVGNASHVLNQIPYVSSTNGVITVFGKGTPLIYINNRILQDPTELTRMASTDIKTIQVILAPGPEYDASVSAVILITTKKQAGDGLSGTFYTMADQGQFFQGVSSFVLNYRSGAWDYFASGGYNRGNIKKESTKTQRFTAQQALFSQESWLMRRIIINAYFPEIGLSYNPTPRHSLGASYSGVIYDAEIPEENKMNTVIHDVLEKEVQQTENLNKNFQHTFNLYYNMQLTDRITLKTNVDYSRGAQQLSQKVSLMNQHRPINIEGGSQYRLFSAKSILGWSIKNSQLTCGASYIKTDNKQSYHIDREDLGITGLINKALQDRFALFASSQTSWGVWSLNGGLRYERLHFNYYVGEDRQQEPSTLYSRLFPSITVNYNPSEVQMSLGYRPGIYYPTYHQLRSYVEYESPFLFRSGNPTLLPTIRHALNFIFSWKDLTVISAFAHNRNDIIQSSSIIENRPVVILKDKNLKGTKRANIAISYAQEVGIWSPSWELGLSKQWIKTGDPIIRYEDPMLSYTWQNTLTLAKNWVFRCDIEGHSAGHRGIFYLSPAWRLDCSLRKNMLNNRLIVKLEGTDIFRSERIKLQNIYSNIRLSENRYSDSQRVSLTIVYRFNATDRKYKGDTYNEEKERL